MKSGPKPQVVTCHPGEKHCAFGLCQSCYHKYKKPNQDERRRINLKHKYGITPEQWDRMWLAQGGFCKICDRPPTRRRLAVDHDHKTGRVRGLLCWWCNNRIVTARVSATVLRRAADYLESTFDGRDL